MSTSNRIAILHIGQSKAGSTSIQNALCGYDDGSAFYATFSPNNHASVIYTGFSDDKQSATFWERHGVGVEDIRRMRKEWLAEFSALLKRRDRDRIIVSAESVFRMAPEAKARLVDFIRQYGWNVQVIAYVREPAIWAASNLSNRIRFGDTFPCRAESAFRLGLEPFMDILPSERLHVRPFAPEQPAGGEPVKDFFETLGLDLSKVEALHEKKDLPLAAMKLLYRFNESGILGRCDPVVYAARMRFVSKVEAKYAGPDRLDPAYCEGIADYSETDWLYEKFGIDFRRKSLTRNTKADLEAALGDISDVDISGLDELLAGYGIRYEHLSTVEHKLHRLFYAIQVEQAIQYRGAALFRKPGRHLAAMLHYRMLKTLSKSRLVTSSKREALARAAIDVRNRWIAKR